MQLSILGINSFIGGVLLAAMPLLLLTPLGHSSVEWHILVGASLVMWFTRQGGIGATLVSLKPYRWLIAALAFALVPIFAFMLLHRLTLGAEIERALRLCLGCTFVLGAVLSMKPLWLRQSSWGFALAGWASTIYATWPAEREEGRPLLPEYNAVSYGNLMLLFAVVVMFSTRWQLTRWSVVEKWIKWITVLVTLFGFVQTQTRTGWLAMPVFGIIWLCLIGWAKRPVRTILAAIALMIVCATVFLSIPKLHERALMGVREVAECIEVNQTAYSSTCIRLQLWRSAIDMLKDNPWLGIGKRNNFQDGLRARVAKGLVSKVVADNWGEAHSDMMMVLATQGIFGGIALLLIYFAPAWLFAKRLGQHIPPNARVAAAMGLAICLGFAIFGLTELMFRGMRTVGFYAVTVGWLLALSDPSAESSSI